MHYLITGVAGFIGSSICDRLLSEGHKVTGVDCFIPYYPKEIKLNNIVAARDHSNFKFIEDNLLNLDLVNILDGVDVIIHQAAQAGVRASWSSYFETYSNNNVFATQVLLDAATKHKQIKKIVFASSSSIYGNAESMPTLETALPQPVSPYGVTKLASEHLMSLYATEFGQPTVSLRYFTVFGPRQRPDMAFNRFIKAALQKESLTLYGDGKQSRDFTYISDIVDANLLAVEKGEPGSVFNIGGGTRATVNEVLSIIENNLGKLSIIREDRQRGDARHTAADTTLARNCLNFQPKFDLATGIKKEIEWMESIL